MSTPPFVSLSTLCSVIVGLFEGAVVPTFPGSGGSAPATKVSVVPTVGGTAYSVDGGLWRDVVAPTVEELRALVATRTGPGWNPIRGREALPTSGEAQAYLLRRLEGFPQYRGWVR